MSSDLSPGASSQRNFGMARSSQDSSGDNVILTPRSKIRKLLSAFDDSDSDKENQNTSPRPKSKSTQATKLAPRPSPQLAQAENALPATPATTIPRTSRNESILNAIFEDDSESGSEATRPYASHPAESASDQTELDRQDHDLSGSTLASPRPSSAHGSSPFVSAARPSRDDDDVALDSDDLQVASNNRNRLQELVARRRAEREAKEKEQEANEHLETDKTDQVANDSVQKKPVKRAAVIVESENSDTDNVAGRKFTQDARPARKASKKAIEEMRRETQRMSRNMQLAHEARTKTKFTTADLFKKMGFRQPAASAQASSSSAAPSSDIEGPAEPAATPPSSPPSLGQSPTKHGSIAPVTASESGGTMPRSLIAGGHVRIPQGESLEMSKQWRPGTTAHPTSPRAANPSLRQFFKSAKAPRPSGDSDDDLEIIQPRVTKASAILDNVPEKKAKESKSIHALRALAHLNDSGSSKRLPKSMTAFELQQLIQLRAREQTKAGLEEKRKRAIERGELFLDDETLEKDQVETHDLIERARKEDEELAKREKEAAKREAKEGGGDVDDLTDSGDEDYEASDEEGGENASASGNEDDDEDEDDELSGSEDEVEPAAEPAEDQDQSLQPHVQSNSPPTTTLVDDAAVSESSEDARSDPNFEDAITPKQRRSNARRAIVDSDDEALGDAAVPATAQQLRLITPAKTPNVALNAAFGFNKAGGSPTLGLSQIFGGTMAGSQTQDSQPAEASLSLPVSPLVGGDAFALPQSMTTSPAMAIGTQVEASQLHETPSRRPNTCGRIDLASQLEDEPIQTQLSEFPAPTQDAGFEVGPSPAKYMHAQNLAETQQTYSTVDTVPVVEETATPVQHRPGRLQRGRPRIEVASSQEDANTGSGDEEVGSGNAFLVMKKASKQPNQVPNFNKKDSKALAMLEEQAEESEDEYAGLGGASDDESGGELDAETRRMIDDAGKEKVNERQIAQRYNEQRLADDEKQTSKLFKDVTTGAWRRKRGAQDDFFDEDDDEEEAAARRRAAKQREFAKMRKALLADEKIGKIAQNPKREAFLKAIEDFVPEHEMNFLGEAEDEPSQIADSQAENRSQGNSVIEGAGRKRAHHVDDVNERDDTSHKQSRRSSHRPAREAVPDIRRTLSEMIGEPEPALGEDNPLEGEDGLNEGMDEGDASEDTRWTKPAAAPSPNPRRTNINAGRKAVIDRMALKRGSTSSTSNTGSSDRLAFNVMPSGSTGSFKVPSLLRRATTNASNVSDTGVTSMANTGIGIGKEPVKMGGSKKSSVNYYVREQERRAKVDEIERQRREGHTRIGRMRRDAVGLGSLGGGSFE